MIKPLLEGLGVTIRHAIRPRVTMQYPDERWEPYPRYRGRHKLLTDEEGRLKCVACLLCATVCPAECITIEAAETEDTAIEKYPARFDIDALRCVFCGFCVDACPEEAIIMSREYEQAMFSRDATIWDIDFLMNRKEFSQSDLGYRPRYEKKGRSGTRG